MYVSLTVTLMVAYTGFHCFVDCFAEWWGALQSGESKTRRIGAEQATSRHSTCNLFWSPAKAVPNAMELCTGVSCRTSVVSLVLVSPPTQT